VTAPRPHDAHPAAGGGAGKRDGPPRSWRHHSRAVESQEPDLDLPVHDERELVLRGCAPARGAFRADGLDHVFDVLADGNLLVRASLRGHLEDVREDVIPGIVVDDLDAALLVVPEGTEAGSGVLHLLSPFRWLLLTALGILVKQTGVVAEA
jgi:hypothetical protein